MKKEMIAAFEQEVGYVFQDKNLISTALTHSSYSNEKRWEKHRCNERLEFLGDAVLEYQLLEESGPDHCKKYTMAVIVDGEQMAVATGQTKKKAEQAAAYQAILRMGVKAQEQKKKQQ